MRTYFFIVCLLLLFVIQYKSNAAWKQLLHESNQSITDIDFIGDSILVSQWVVSYYGPGQPRHLGFISWSNNEGNNFNICSSFEYPALRFLINKSNCYINTWDFFLQTQKCDNNLNKIFTHQEVDPDPLIKLLDEIYYVPGNSNILYHYNEISSQWDTLLSFPEQNFKVINENQNIVYIVSNTGIYYTLDQFTSWVLLNSDYNLNNSTVIKVFDNMIALSDTSGKVFISTDAGKNFESINDTFLIKNITCFDYYKGNLFIGTDKNGVFLYRTDIKTINNIGLQGVLCRKISMINDKLYAVCWFDGLYVNDLMDVELSINKESIISNCSISPNPADDYLNIRFDGKQLSTISIINSRGIIVFKNNYYSNNISIDTKYFFEGMYVLQIQSSNNIEKKIFLILH